MVHKGKRARITSEGEAHIYKRSIEEPRKQRTELAKALQNELKDMGFDMPELEVLERKVSKYRNEKRDPKDEPFTLAALADNSMFVEHLPVILRAYLAEYIAMAQAGLPIPRPPLTIREALWIARLSSVLNDTFSLLKYAKEYATQERISRVLNKPLPSSETDILLLHQVKDELCKEFGIDEDSINKAFPAITKIEISLPEINKDKEAQNE